MMSHVLRKVCGSNGTWWCRSLLDGCTPNPYHPFVCYAMIHNKAVKQEVKFGMCFDIDGVLARGYVPLPEAAAAVQKLKLGGQKLQVPVVFVTNAVTPNAYKAGQLSEWLNMKITPSQMVQAHGPLEMYTDYHDKRCLVIGQGDILNIAEELGFTSVCTIAEITEAYPLLDVGDHQRRFKVATADINEPGFPPVEAVVLLGEPCRWESALQLILDLLLTKGSPKHGSKRYNTQTIPIIACDMDLKYMHRASFERFGHGAFLLCLEQLFKKVTGEPLMYDALVGKPSEVTFRFAEHCLAKEAIRLGLSSPVETMYMIGDNREVDIAGANLYQNMISQTPSPHPERGDPTARDIPSHGSDRLLPRAVTAVHGVLVRTGVHQAGDEAADLSFQSHRDFPLSSDLLIPSVTCDSVQDAVDYIIKRELS